MNFESLVIGFVAGLIANYIFALLVRRFKKSKPDQIKRILKNEKNWNGLYGGPYSHIKEPEFQIHISEGQSNLADRFKKFPDREHDKISWIELRFNDFCLFGWNFMYLDGCNILIPVPKTEFDANDNPYDYYDFSSVEMKIFEIIGKTRSLGENKKLSDLKLIAKKLSILIREGY
jgi:hypothetical protein